MLGKLLTRKFGMDLRGRGLSFALDQNGSSMVLPSKNLMASLDFGGNTTATGSENRLAKNSSFRIIDGGNLGH